MSNNKRTWERMGGFDMNDKKTENDKVDNKHKINTFGIKRKYNFQGQENNDRYQASRRYNVMFGIKRKYEESQDDNNLLCKKNKENYKTRMLYVCILHNNDSNICQIYQCDGNCDLIAVDIKDYLL